MPEKEREKIAREIIKGKRRTVRNERRLKNYKNYDSKKINSLFSKIRKKKIYQKVKDPSARQKQVRDEWQ